MRQSERGRKEGQGGRGAAAKRATEGLSKPRESGAQRAISGEATRGDGAKGGSPAGGPRTEDGGRGGRGKGAGKGQRIERQKGYAKLVRKAKLPAQMAPWTLDESVDVERAAAAPATRSASSLPATPVWLATFQIRSLMSEETERQSRRAAR